VKRRRRARHGGARPKSGPYLAAPLSRSLRRTASHPEFTIDKRLIYRSQPFGFDRAMLAGILSAARRNNPRGGITGALICRQDLYLQLIEGPAEAIDTLYARICEDDRHANIELLLTEDMGERMFPGWAMLDDTAPSMSWSAQDVAAGALKAASPDELRAPFLRLSAGQPNR
jgi:Sensors of blue-light using FAD